VQALTEEEEEEEEEGEEEGAGGLAAGRARPPSLRVFPHCLGTCCFALMSQMNHACDANVVVAYGANHTGAAVATRDIAAGEELCISYIDATQDVRGRQEDLENYGFVCTCPKCLAEGGGKGKRKVEATQRTVDPVLASQVLFCTCMIQVYKRMIPSRFGGGAVFETSCRAGLRFNLEVVVVGEESERNMAPSLSLYGWSSFSAPAERQAALKRAQKDLGWLCISE
jgi:hypothetical protein